MAADKRKKAKVGEPEPVDEDLVLNIEKLEEIEEVLDEINEEADDKVFEVKQKYNEICKPVYVKRADIIKTIPNFWLTTFLNHPVLGVLLSQKDQEVFKFMHSIEVDDFKDEKMGYSITFNFTENPYFVDKKLTKSYALADDGTTNISGTEIWWKEGMDLLANGNVQEKKESKRPFVEKSFFSWFNENSQENLPDEMDEVAEIIKEDLWHAPLKYFNNKIDEDDFDSEDDDEEIDEDGEDDDETDE